MLSDKRTLGVFPEFGAPADEEVYDTLGFTATAGKSLSLAAKTTPTFQFAEEYKLTRDYLETLNLQTDNMFKDFDALQLFAANTKSGSTSYIGGRYMAQGYDELRNAIDVDKRVTAFEERLAEAKRLYPQIEVKQLHQISDEAKAKRRSNELSMQKGREGESFFGNIVGSIGGMLTDPLFVATSAISMGSGMPAMILSNMAGEVVYQSFLEDKPLEEKAQEVAVVGAFSAALGAAGKGMAAAVKSKFGQILTRSVAKTAEAMRSKGTHTVAKELNTLAEEVGKTAEELGKSTGKGPSPEVEAFKYELKADADLLSANKYGDTVAAKERFFEEMKVAEEEFLNHGRIAPDAVVEGRPRLKPILEETANLEKQLNRNRTPRGMEAQASVATEDFAGGLTRTSPDAAIADVMGSVVDESVVGAGAVKPVSTILAEKARVTTSFDPAGNPMVFATISEAERAMGKLPNNGIYSIVPMKDGRFAVMEPTDTKFIPNKVFDTEEAAKAAIKSTAEKLGLEESEITALKMTKDLDPNAVGEGKYGLAMNATEREVLGSKLELPSSIRGIGFRAKLPKEILDAPISKGTAGPTTLVEAIERMGEPVLKKADRVAREAKKKAFVSKRIAQGLNMKRAKELAATLGYRDEKEAASKIEGIKRIIKEFEECMNG